MTTFITKLFFFLNVSLFSRKIIGMWSVKQVTSPSGAAGGNILPPCLCGFRHGSIDLQVGYDPEASHRRAKRSPTDAITTSDPSSALLIPGNLHGLFFSELSPKLPVFL